MSIRDVCVCVMFDLDEVRHAGEDFQEAVSVFVFLHFIYYLTLEFYL